MSFNDFVHKHKVKNEATSNIKIYQALSSLSLNDVDIYLRDGSFSRDMGNLNPDPSKGTHWIFYINKNFLIVMDVFLLKNHLSLL